MEKKRLIDVDALKAIFDDHSIFYAPEDYFLVLDVINEAPAIETESVVRCKDCKHCSVEKNWNGRNYHACNLNAGCVYEVEPEHYCSYGERKVGAENA